MPPATDVALNDYLYLDRDRIAAYHTQLRGSGTPLQSKFTQSFKESSEKSGEASAHFIKGGIRGEVESTDGTERTFDQSWPMIMATIAELYDRGWVRKTALGVPVGSLIEQTGLLQVVDLRVMRELWSPITKLLARGQQSKAKIPTRSVLSNMAEFAKYIPHPMVAQMITNPEDKPFEFGESSLVGWGLLDTKNILGNADAFALMNGGLFGGLYSMIAVLDIGANSEAAPFVDPFENWEVNNSFEMMLGMQQYIRSIFGRPNYANGVTPLAIYRALPHDVGDGEP